MSKEFEIRRSVELPVSAEEVFAAVTTGTAGWMFPTGLAVTEAGDKPDDPQVTGWRPPQEFSVRQEGEDGWFNALEYLIEARDDGHAVLRYVHSGIFVDDWDNQYDGAAKHTDFYLHSLGQYLRYFAGRHATYVATEGPSRSATAGSFDQLRDRLGLSQAETNDAVRLAVPGLDPVDAVVDYHNQYFLGLRANNGLYRFFGRGAWGAPVGVSLHLFDANVDREKTEQAWHAWLAGMFE